MIKRNKTQVKAKLLRKMSDESYPDQVPFEIEQSQFCPSEIMDKDRSYICLNGNMITNPYLYEESEPDCETKPEPRKPTPQYRPTVVQMNGVRFKKVEIANEEKRAICSVCRTHQLIPLKAAKFYCYKCYKISNSVIEEPKVQQPQLKQPQKLQRSGSNCSARSQKMDIFICWSCKSKVHYQKGLSQYYKCSKCNMVNQVHM